MRNNSISSCFFVWLLVSLLSGNCYAQTELEPDAEPVSETEIVCFAALKQWVCAPKDEQQKAHEKAMKLAEEQGGNEFSQNDQVEIKTIETNPDFSQQVQELPVETLTRQGVVSQPINDFIPRPSQSSASDSAESKTAEPTAIDSEEIVTTEDQENSSQSSVSPAPKVVSSSFKDWLNNHPNHWSFQVVGTSNQHHLNQFIIDNDLQKLIHTTVKTQVNGAEWWIILVGLYDSRDQALNQRDQLPAQLSSQAWVRQINTIKSE